MFAVYRLRIACHFTELFSLINDNVLTNIPARQAHTTPLRLLHPLPTFPFLQLSLFPSLLSSLSLTQNSFVDAYNPLLRQWEQHTTSTVRLVYSEQRILYRLRRSLLEGLSEDECPGIQEEIAMQPASEQLQPQRLMHGAAGPMPTANSNGLKRPAPPSDPGESPVPPPKYYVADMYRSNPQGPYAVPIPIPQGYPQGLSTPKQQPQPQPQVHQNGAGGTQPQTPGPAGRQQQQRQNGAMKPPGPAPAPVSAPYAYPQNNMYGAPPPQSPPQPVQNMGAIADANGSAMALPSADTLPPHLRTPHAVPAPIPYHPHPPLKRWPNDYTVSEVAAGFRQMDALVGTQPTTTQRAAFERVFGCRYVKSTVCRHRGVWRRAREDVRAAFEHMGRDEHAVWGEFVRRVEGRASGLQGSPRAGHGLTEGMVHMQGHVMPGGMQGMGHGPVSQHLMRREEEESPEEAVMGSLGPPPEHEAPPNQTGMLNGSGRESWPSTLRRRCVDGF